MKFTVRLSPDAQQTIVTLDQRKKAKVKHCLNRLGENPRHPGLHTHKFEAMFGPDGQAIFESYVENHVPGSWRVWWYYGPGQEVITVAVIGPHP